LIKAYIDYHRVGLQGAFSLEGMIDPTKPEAGCFEIYDGIAFAFLIPPPTTAAEYLGEYLNALNPGAYERVLTFDEAIEELKAGMAARERFAREHAGK
jgi:hypothetical protein